MNQPSDDAASGRSPLEGSESVHSGATGDFGSNRAEMTAADQALAHLRSDMAVQDLRRRRSSVDRKRAEATIASCLVSSVGSQATLSVMDGTTLSGRVVEVGRDYVCIEKGSSPTWVTLESIVAVRTTTDPGNSTTSDSTIGSGLVDVIEDLIMSESDVLVSLQGGHSVAGTPVSTGELLTLRNTGSYEMVPLSRIVKIAVAPMTRRTSADR